MNTSGGGAAPVEIDFYWRPGCPFCMSLERSLQKLAVPFTKHNIWDDPAAAAFVRSVANGNETVPTVRVGETSLVNPSAKDVVKAAAMELPGFIPESRRPRGLRPSLRRDLFSD
ncbi:MAG: NrdH-redoxin [Acidimicrobiia bacterium]|nr:NrdH-redoxin [Acidimicrobiia bacterium]